MTIARQLHRYTATQRRTYTDRHTYTDTAQHITPTQQTEDQQRDTADRHVFVCACVGVGVCRCMYLCARVLIRTGQFLWKLILCESC